MGNGALTPPEDLSDEVKERSNIALIFIKPHCSGSEKVRDFVKAEIKGAGLTVLGEGGMSGEDIEEKVSAASQSRSDELSEGVGRLVASCV